jgi:hypothetical protein
MPSISYDTAFEVWLSAGFILYYILVHACIAAETLRGHLSKWIRGSVQVRSFPSLCNQGQSVDFLLHKAIFHCVRRYICGKYLEIVTLRYFNKCHTNNIVLTRKSCVGSAFLNKMVAWGKRNHA